MIPEKRKALTRHPKTGQLENPITQEKKAAMRRFGITGKRYRMLVQRGRRLEKEASR